MAFTASWELRAEEAYEIIVPTEELHRVRHLNDELSRRKERLSYQGRVQKIRFRSEQEKEEALEKLEQEGIPWEENASFSADTLIIEDPYQADINPMDYSPHFHEQWSFWNSGDTSSASVKGADIDMVRAWEIQEGAPNVVIYIMDSGIYTEDPDLEGRVTSSYNALDPSSAPIDENGHGTHVASVATAQAVHGISGVVRGEVEVANVRFLNHNNTGKTSAAIDAVEWIEEDFSLRQEENPQVRGVMLNAWGGDTYSAQLESAMKNLAGSDFLFINSAGNKSQNNDNTGYYPCNYELQNAICVASSDENDYLSSFSSYGPASVDMMAPGRFILGTIPGLYLQEKSGTSQAVPHVGGVAALVWGAANEMSASEVKWTMMESVDRLPEAENEVLSGGRLNAYRALLMATGQDPSKADRSFAQEEGKGSGGCSVMVSSSRSGFSVGMILFLAFFFLMVFRKVVSRPRLERGTHWLKASCSTD